MISTLDIFNVSRGIIDISMSHLAIYRLNFLFKVPQTKALLLYDSLDFCTLKKTHWWQYNSANENNIGVLWPPCASSCGGLGGSLGPYHVLYNGRKNQMAYTAKDPHPHSVFCTWEKQKVGSEMEEEKKKKKEKEKRSVCWPTLLQGTWVKNIISHNSLIHKWEMAIIYLLVGNFQKWSPITFSCQLQIKMYQYF